MKRIIRWFMTRFDARVVRLMSAAIEERMLPPILDALEASGDRLERIEAMVGRADRSTSTMAEELDVVLGGLSREVFRLRDQIERLGEGDRPAVAGLSILAESEDDGPMARPEASPIERSRVG